MKKIPLEKTIEGLKNYYSCLKTDGGRCINSCDNCKYKHDYLDLLETIKTAIEYLGEKNEFNNVDDIQKEIEEEWNKNNEKALSQYIIDIEVERKLKSFASDLRIEIHHADLCRDKIELVLDLLDKIENKYNV